MAYLRVDATVFLQRWILDSGLGFAKRETRKTPACQTFNNRSLG